MKVKWRKVALCVFYVLTFYSTKSQRLNSLCLLRQVNFSAPEYVKTSTDSEMHMHWKIIVLILSGFNQCSWHRIFLFFVPACFYHYCKLAKVIIPVLHGKQSYGAFTCLKDCPISSVGKSSFFILLTLWIFTIMWTNHGHYKEDHFCN